MHLLVQESRRLDEDEAAVDLGQTPADIVFLSFSDSDLGAAASAWTTMQPRPRLRLANLGRLRHPMSVDLYLDRVASRARCVVVRLLGGLDYWRYGAEEFSALCRDQAIPLAILAGDERDDDALAALGTVTPAQRTRFDSYLRQGGPTNLRHALHYATHLAGLADDRFDAPETIAACGVHEADADPRAVIVFYRAYLLAGDVAPIDALAGALRARGLPVATVYVASLKNPECAAFVAERLRAWQPSIVLNATGFAAGPSSPLEAAGAPILQVVLAGSTREAWQTAPRGLSQTDLAMCVVLPELDGHLLTGAISFKMPTDADAELQFARTIHAADAEGIALAADRAAAWARLAGASRHDRALAIVLSDYPGGGRRGHAVGLDTFASVAGIAQLLRDEGYDVGDAADVAMLRDAPATPFMSAADYRTRFGSLPDTFRDTVGAAWGDPADDADVRDGWFTIPHVKCGNVVVAIQPDRGDPASRKTSYHDPDSPPRHAFVAFYLWLRDVHAIVHLGAHGTLEWLPGKSVALSETCAPRALLGATPVIYPFIVNNPGEAAAAKRRLGAAIVGHLTPPLRDAGLSGEAASLERLIDEFAAADGLDRRRAATLRKDILTLADESGLLAESGAGPSLSEDAALARLDAYLCDVKELQIRDGLHVFGAASPGRDDLLAALRKASSGVEGLAGRLDQCPAAERAGLLAALDGTFVPAGPAGAPTRGRADVLPTGRNLFSVDPRAIPTRSAVALAEAQCAEFLRRYVQDHGDWPRRLVVDLWGSATMRTGGEDFSLALLLLGVRPEWDEGSGRVVGFHIVPLALLDRPRVDVTLRISGLFRDAFEAQTRLFDSAVRAVARRDEACDWNTLAGADNPARIFGPAPGCYGAGTERLLAGPARDVGAAYIEGSAFAYAQDGCRPAAAMFAERIGTAEALLHVQDHAETDLLDGIDYAAQVGGFAAAAALLDNTPTLYHVDTSRSDGARLRTVADEVARVVRGKAANPVWIAGMMRHGYSGAAEIARNVDALCGFAATLPQRFDRQFDLIFAATLGDERVDRFLREANPDARNAMTSRFHEARKRALWHPRRNDVGQEF